MPVDVSPTWSGSRENAFTASYRAEWAHFEAAIAGEAKVASLQEHLVLHRIMDAVYKSAEDGRDVIAVSADDGVGPAACSWRCSAVAVLPGDLAAAAPPSSPRRPAAVLPIRPHRLPHDLRPRRAGLGAVRAQRDLDPRPGARHRPGLQLRAVRLRTRRTSSSASSAGRCGTGWRAFRRDRYVGQYERDNRSVWIQELELSAAARRPSCSASCGGTRSPSTGSTITTTTATTAPPGCATRSTACSAARCAARPSRSPDRHHLPISHPAAHRERPAHLHRAAASRSGEGVDRPISAWEEMFLPLKLREHVRRVTRAGTERHAACRWSDPSARCSSRPRRRRPTRRRLAALVSGARRRDRRRGLRCSRGARARAPRPASASCCWPAAGRWWRGWRVWCWRGSGVCTDHVMAGSQRESAADEPAGACCCCRAWWDGAREAARRSSRAGAALVVAVLSVLGLVLQAAAGASIRSTGR